MTPDLTFLIHPRKSAEESSEGSLVISNLSYSGGILWEECQNSFSLVFWFGFLIPLSSPSVPLHWVNEFGLFGTLVTDRSGPDLFYYGLLSLTHNRSVKTLFLTLVSLWRSARWDHLEWGPTRTEGQPVHVHFDFKTRCRSVNTHGTVLLNVSIDFRM